jgi:hypothetical protein
MRAIREDVVLTNEDTTSTTSNKSQYISRQVWMKEEVSQNTIGI